MCAVHMTCNFMTKEPTLIVSWKSSYSDYCPFPELKKNLVITKDDYKVGTVVT